MASILIVDDIAANRHLLVRMLTAAGHSVLEADSGEEAVSIAENTLPEMVLMDINMPAMDGYQATQLIRKLNSRIHTPIIFVTALSEQEALSMALKSGGDDYITKPVISNILLSKVNAHLRIRELNSKLVEHNTYLSREHDLISHFFDTIHSQSFLDTNYIQHHISPASVFNGDIFIASRGVNGGLYILIGDFTGHGLSAAMGTLPVSQAFFTAVNQNYSLKQVTRQINDILNTILPVEIFLSAILLEMNPQGDRVSIWSGGMPPVFHVDHQTDQLRTINADHMPLGILSTDEFDDSLQSFSVTPDDKLYLYSDGIIESKNEFGIMYGEKKLFNVLEKNKQDRFDAVLSSFNEHNADDTQHDDITFVELTCNPLEADAESKADNLSIGPPLELSMHLGAKELRETNPIETILDLIITATAQERHRTALFTILSELYNNALEHGVLKLESSKKSNADTFAEYYMDRELGLQELSDGFVDIKIKISYEDSQLRVHFHLTDSGDGFVRKQRADQSNYHGRGIPIINDLCESIEYSEGGRSVDAVFISS